MAKRGRKKSSKRRVNSSANRCCPIITVRCPRVGKRLNGLGDLPAFMRSAEQIFSDRRGAAESAATAARRAGVLKKRVMCTVRAGGTSRRVNVFGVKPLVAKLVAAQKKRRCVPLVKRG